MLRPSEQNMEIFVNFSHNVTGSGYKIEILKV